MRPPVLDESTALSFCDATPLQGALERGSTRELRRTTLRISRRAAVAIVAAVGRHAGTRVAARSSPQGIPALSRAIARMSELTSPRLMGRTARRPSAIPQIPPLRTSTLRTVWSRRQPSDHRGLSSPRSRRRACAPRSGAIGSTCAIGLLARDASRPPTSPRLALARRSKRHPASRVFRISADLYGEPPDHQERGDEPTSSDRRDALHLRRGTATANLQVQSLRAIWSRHGTRAGDMPGTSRPRQRYRVSTEPRGCEPRARADPELLVDLVPSPLGARWGRLQTRRMRDQVRRRLTGSKPRRGSSSTASAEDRILELSAGRPDLASLMARTAVVAVDSIPTCCVT